MIELTGKYNTAKVFTDAKLIYILYQYIYLYRKMFAVPLEKERREYHILEQSSEGKCRNPRIVVSEKVQIPQLLGFFRPTIYIPAESFSDQELYYILKHEWTHFHLRDNWIKLLVNIYCCVFWWNVSVYLLRLSLNQTLEIKCDYYTTKDATQVEKLEYLEVLLTILDNNQEKPHSMTLLGNHFTGSRKRDNIRQRFTLLTSPPSPTLTSKLIYVFILAVLLVSLCISFFVTIQPHYEPHDFDIGSNEFIISQDNAFIVSDNNNYSLYLYNDYFTSISEADLRHLMQQGIPVYEVGAQL